MFAYKYLWFGLLGRSADVVEFEHAFPLFEVTRKLAEDFARVDHHLLLLHERLPISDMTRQCFVPGTIGIEIQ